jgi:DNA-binding NarL/FixJ family response regulator
MAIDRVALDEAWHKLINIEEEYYELLAICSLLQEGILTYSKEAVREKKDYIKHHYPELSVLFNPLTGKELLCIYYAACGKEVKETAIALRVSESFIKQLRASAFYKLRAKKVGRALTNAMRYGYLPLKDNSSFLHSIDKELSLDFTMLKKITRSHFEKN